jgi:hypothetical protein
LSDRIQAAWGKLQKEGTQIHITNYELGVLFKDCSAFSFPVPFVVPPPQYSASDVPWMFDKEAVDLV